MFGLLEKGLSCQICLIPEITGPGIIDLSNWRKMGVVVELTANHERVACNYAGATDACISLLRYADLVHHGPGNLSSYLVAIHMLETGLEQARDIARSDQIPRDQLKRLSTALADLGPFDHGLICALKLEFQWTLNQIDNINEDDSSNEDRINQNDLESLEKTKRNRVWLAA